jgi:hypothetical protein
MQLGEPPFYSSTTKNGNAQATVKFEGNAVYVFGGTGTSHGSYSVAVDGGPAESYSGATLVQENYQVLLVCTPNPISHPLYNDTT